MMEATSSVMRMPLQEELLFTRFVRAAACPMGIRTRLPVLFDKEDARGSAARLLAVSQQTNLMFFDMSQRGEMVYQDAWDKGHTRTNIERVGEREKRRIGRIAEKFPHAWPLNEQCAYLLRAYSGLQLYPDANHRTGMAIAAFHALVEHHVLEARPEVAAQYVYDVRDPRSPLNARRTVKRILERDGSFEHLARFYAEILTAVPWWRRRSVQRRILRGTFADQITALVPMETAEAEQARKAGS